MLKKIIKVLSVLSFAFIICSIIHAVVNSVNGTTFLGDTVYYGFDAFDITMLTYMYGIPHIFIPAYIVIIIDLIVNRKEDRKFIIFFKIFLLLLPIITLIL